VRGIQSSPKLLRRLCAPAGAGFKVTGYPRSGRLWAGAPIKTQTCRFLYSRFCFLIRTNGRNTNAAGISAPPYEGGVRRSGWRRSVRVREQRSRQIRSRCAREGGSIEAGADDNQRIMTFDCFLPKKPVIMQLSADPSDFFCRAWQAASKLARSGAGENRGGARSLRQSPLRPRGVSGKGATLDHFQFPA
jgi:hypothetical protein